MKKCPRCGQSYADADLNFCLNDGELLAYFSDPIPGGPFSDEPPPTRFADDSPPTLMMNSPRDTNPVGWAGSAPVVPWQTQTPVYQSPQFGMQQYGRVGDQTLPTVSLVLGIFACLFICCFGGIWLGLPAAIVGFLGLKNSEKDPGRFSGRGLAIAGLVIGLITFVISIIHLIASVLA